jgi:hypothetical protein
MAQDISHVEQKVSSIFLIYFSPNSLCLPVASVENEPEDKPLRRAWPSAWTEATPGVDLGHFFRPNYRHGQRLRA